MTAALEGGEWSASRPGRSLLPGKEPVPILQEGGWAPGPVWTGGNSCPHRDSIPDRQPVASRYTDWATRPIYIYIHTHTMTGLKFKEETSKALHLEHGFVWCWKLDTSKIKSEIPGNFWNVVLEKDGVDQWVQSCETWRSVAESLGGEKYLIH